MSFFGGVVGGPLQGSSDVPVAATPVLAFLDNGLSTGGTATISNSTGGSGNKIYVQPYQGAIVPTAWSLAGERTGNGTVTLTLPPGNYLAYVTSEVADDSAASSSISLIVAAVDQAAPENVTGELIGSGHPFRRLSVDHMVYGVSRIWWEYVDEFNDTGPYTTQLQYGRAGHNNAVDWVNVGLPATNTNYATDETTREYGNTLNTYYRIALTTLRGIYVSPPIGCSGELPESDWLLAREIVRKELLRQHLAGRDGYLLKRIRSGEVCDVCVDPLTDEVLNSDCPQCYGTGFKTGYFAPAPCVCFDLTPRENSEHQEYEFRGTVSPSASVARTIAYPPMDVRDVWIDANSDERWVVEQIKNISEIRGVPIIVSVALNRATFTDVIYKIPVGGELHEDEPAELPDSGDGSVLVDHDWGSHDELSYTTASGIPIIGATILAFTQAVFDAASPAIPNSSLAVASSTTVANGRWAYALSLDPGDYVLVFHKQGAFGPDTVEITVS